MYFIGGTTLIFDINSVSGSFGVVQCTSYTKYVVS